MSTAFAPKTPTTPPEEKGADAQSDYLARLNRAMDSFAVADEPTPPPAPLPVAPSATPRRSLAETSTEHSLAETRPLVKTPSPVAPPWAQAANSSAGTSSATPASAVNSGATLRVARDDESIEVDRSNFPAPPPKIPKPAVVAPVVDQPKFYPGLLTRDLWTNSAWACAIAMAIGLVFAQPAAQRAHTTYVTPVLADIESILSHPLSAQAGSIQSPDQALAALDSAADQVTHRFWQVWLGVSIVIALPLLLIRRNRLRERA